MLCAVLARTLLFRMEKLRVPYISVSCKIPTPLLSSYIGSTPTSSHETKDRNVCIHISLAVPTSALSLAKLEKPALGNISPSHESGSSDEGLVTLNRSIMRNPGHSHLYFSVCSVETASLCSHFSCLSFSHNSMKLDNLECATCHLVR